MHLIIFKGLLQCFEIALPYMWGTQKITDAKNRTVRIGATEAETS